MHLTSEAKVLTGIIAVTIAIVAGAVFFLSQPEKPVVVDTSRLVREDSNRIATGSGKLTIVEFGDYQCPACWVAHAPLKQAVAQYSDQVLLIFRHFPLTQHKNGEIAARAAEAAKMQGKLVEMHDKLYETQDEWDDEANALEFFKKYAGELGIDVAKFAADINSESAKQKVRDDLTDGLALNVNSTPTFYFNGELYKGGIGYEEFKKAIESRLK